MGIDNVKLSKELMIKYYDPNNKTHLPVIQGYYNDPNSFDEYSDWFLNKYPEPKKVGVGTVCKNSGRQTLFKTLKIVRKNFPNSHIHAFGLTIKYVDKFKYIIDSFDSTAWTFPRGQGHSCKNKQERIEYFEEYLEIFQNKNRILDQELTAFF